MKQTLTILICIILFSSNIFSQNDNDKLKKHYWAADFGVTYNHKDKDEYFFSDRFYYYGQITPFPGHYSYSTTTVHSSIFKSFTILKYFQIGAGVMYYNEKYNQYTPIDTILKYPVFPDSIIENGTFTFVNRPVYSKVNSNTIRFSIELGFKIRRFSFLYRKHFAIANFYFYNNIYNGDIKAKYFKTFLIGETSDYYNASIGLKYQIIKDRPINFYFFYNSNYLFGVEYIF